MNYIQATPTGRRSYLGPTFFLEFSFVKKLLFTYLHTSAGIYWLISLLFDVGVLVRSARFLLICFFLSSSRCSDYASHSIILVDSRPLSDLNLFILLSCCSLFIVAHADISTMWWLWEEESLKCPMSLMARSRSLNSFSTICCQSSINLGKSHNFQEVTDFNIWFALSALLVVQLCSIWPFLTGVITCDSSSGKSLLLK